MRTSYCEEDDILIIHLSDKPVVKEVSQDWNTHVSYAEDGSVVEITVVDAHAFGVIPVRYFPDTDTCYIEFHKGDISETLDLDGNALLDVDAASKIVAMTIEHARKLMPAEAFAA